METNTFSATTIAQEDYGLESAVDDINVYSAKVAREAVDEFAAENPGRKCYVAGALGPTNRTASISPDVNNPAFRAVTYKQLEDSFYQQARGLLQGGVDIFLPETSIDTLNIKAAISALQRLLMRLAIACLLCSPLLFLINQVEPFRVKPSRPFGTLCVTVIQ